MSNPFDLAILGSGFGGSLLAMVARRLGMRVLLLERGSHPRFAIGESTSPLTNLLLEKIARDFDLPRLLPLTQYGAWKRAYPELTVGLKRGFSFYHHVAGEPFASDPERNRQLLVAASPNNAVADTHWYRPEFDHFLVREAQALGVEYVDRVSIDGLTRTGGCTELSGAREGQAVRYQAGFVVDATGPRGALTRLLGLPEAEFAGYPPTQALFTHFAGVDRFAPLAGTPGEPPYAPDDAALHHVFGGGWMWMLRFENGVTSAGIAVEDRLARELRLEDKDAAWDRFLARYHSILEQFQGATPVLPFIHAPRLAYRTRTVTGEGWALLPSAAAFVDPLFSTGFPLTLLGIRRLATALSLRGTAAFPIQLREYERRTLREADTTASLVAGCYAAFPEFPAFAALSMVYFTAASYSEMARRLDRPQLASEFLLGNQPAFYAALRRHAEAAGRGEPASAEEIAADLEPFNIAGLSDPAKRNWYGVDLEDVAHGAAKLSCSEAEVRRGIVKMLQPLS